MDVISWISLIANIAQIISVLWLLFIGSDTIWAFLSKKSSKFTTRGKIGLLAAFVVLIVSTLVWFSTQSHSIKVDVTPTPFTTNIPATNTPAPTLIPTPTPTIVPTSTPTEEPASNIAGTHVGTIYQLATNGTYIPYKLQLSFQQDGGNISGNCQIGDYLYGDFDGTISSSDDVHFVCNVPVNNTGFDTFDFTGKLASDGSLSGMCKEYNPGHIYISDSSWSTD